MLEMLINPKNAERRPWQMFFIGAFYASLSIFLVNQIFSQDAVLSKYSGILLVTFMVMFTMPFIYYTLKYEEEKIKPSSKYSGLLREHTRAIYAFLWLFVGFVVALSFWYTILTSTQSFRAQIETYCLINRPANFEDCIKQYGIKDVTTSTGFLSNKERLFLIFTNNIYVLFFTIIFSLIFGAGVIFVLAWNASVIAAAVGIFTNSSLIQLPIAFFRFFLHGIPEIASYFIVALAGGMVSVAVVNHEFGTDKFWNTLYDALNLTIIGVVILFLAALIEVFITPIFF